MNDARDYDTRYIEVDFEVYHRSSIVSSSTMHFPEDATDEEINAEYKEYEAEVIANISGGWHRNG